MDPAGLRYFLPALMLRLLRAYEPAEVWCIGTVSALAHERRHPRGFLELLTPAQARAIAIYLQALPDLVDLDHEDREVVVGAFRDVWAQHLAGPTD